MYVHEYAARGCGQVAWLRWIEGTFCFCFCLSSSTILPYHFSIEPVRNQNHWKLENLFFCRYCGSCADNNEKHKDKNKDKNKWEKTHCLHLWNTHRAFDVKIKLIYLFYVYMIHTVSIRYIILLLHTVSLLDAPPWVFQMFLVFEFRGFQKLTAHHWVQCDRISNMVTETSKTPNRITSWPESGMLHTHAHAF